MALEDLMADSSEEGRAEGRKAAFIEAYQEFHVSREETIDRLCEKFDLSRECAEGYVQKYWK